MNSNNVYAALEANPAVKSIEFVGGGIARVTLNEGFENEAFAKAHGLENNQVLYAHKAAVAQEFVDGAVEYHMVPNARFGGMTKEAKGTPFACSVASESYWCS